ncbi:MAG: hypothetical protein ACE5HY_01670 [Candidatus Hydrothermarchaeales archaeon]
MPDIVKSINIPEAERRWMKTEGLNKLNELREDMQIKYSGKVFIDNFRTNKRGDRLYVNLFAIAELFQEIVSEFNEILSEHEMDLEGPYLP